MSNPTAWFDQLVEDEFDRELRNGALVVTHRYCGAHCTIPAAVEFDPKPLWTTLRWSWIADHLRGKCWVTAP